MADCEKLLARIASSFCALLALALLDPAALGAAPLSSRDRDAMVSANATDDPDLPRVLLIGDSIAIGYAPYVRERLNGHANVHRIPANGGALDRTGTPT